MSATPALQPHPASAALEDDDDTVREALLEIDRQTSAVTSHPDMPRIPVPMMPAADPGGRLGANPTKPPPLPSMYSNPSYPPNPTYVPPGYVHPGAYPAAMGSVASYTHGGMNSAGYSDGMYVPYAPPTGPVGPVGHPGMGMNPGHGDPGTHHPRAASSLIALFSDEVKMAAIVASVVVLTNSEWFDSFITRLVGYAAESAAGPFIILTAKIVCALVLSYALRWAWARLHRWVAGIVHRTDHSTGIVYGKTH